MFCCMRASASGLMALLVLWFFPLNIFIHVTVRCDAEHVALLPGGQYTGHCTAADNQPGPHNRPSSTSLPAVHTETRTAADPEHQYLTNRRLDTVFFLLPSLLFRVWSGARAETRGPKGRERGSSSWGWGSRPSPHRHHLGVLDWRSAVSSPNGVGAEPRPLKNFLAS